MECVIPCHSLSAAHASSAPMLLLLQGWICGSPRLTGAEANIPARLSPVRCQYPVIVQEQHYLFDEEAKIL